MNESTSCISLSDTPNSPQDPNQTPLPKLKIKLNRDDESNCSNNSPTPQHVGFKLILKRQHGDRYEVKNVTTTNSSSCSFDSGSSRPKREAAKRVKFNFDESDESPVKKRPKSTSSNSQPRIKLPKFFPEICLPFNSTEIIEKDDLLIQEISNIQVKVSINHSVPFPIALVEDKTNIVHTKALLLIHLYQSYSSPCIICVLCKNFFSIPDFSKHFHISEDDLDTESSDDDLDQNTYHNFLSELDERKEKKLRKLRKKSYKILPYFLNQNNELNENQLKTWKLFSSKFTSYKILRQKKVDEQKELQAKIEQEKLDKKKKKLLRPKSKRKTDPEACNWDFIEDEKEDKYFYVNRNRLECEKIVYLKENGKRLSDMDTDSEVEKNEPKITQKKSQPDIKKPVDLDESDLSLSEDDDELEINSKPKEQNKIYFYEQSPSLLEKQFNYYENLTPEVLNYLNRESSLVQTMSLLMFNLANKLKEKRKVLLAETNFYRLKWLVLALDLEVSKKYL
ncbi:unnamed protein product [Brachionus calyciflorus]|uniref:c-SKI SMAD4-binding domain-containing protein n=1 Tax=Brachionus calyciflorus TaxID=104777 RepID=A0A813VG60_9BILA|nr:unnamed protein product [Brachionus calyciflorus]